jgi:formylglycine-generating enzyme required for sulfatase activity
VLQSSTATHLNFSPAFPESKSAAKIPAESRPPQPIATEPRKTRNAVIIGVSVGAFVLIAVFSGWWISQQPKKEFERKLEKLISDINHFKNELKNLDEMEEIAKFYRWENNLENEIIDLRYKATTNKMDAQVDELKEYLELASLKLQYKQKELISGLQEIITNTIGMEFKLILSGSFNMGSPTNESGRFSDVEKQHEVTISRPFYLQTTELTQGQWKKVMGDSSYFVQSCGNDCPKVVVSWYGAQKFLNKLNQMESTNKYRLPTEAEWEYACRAGTDTAYSFDNVDKLEEYAWYSANSDDQIHPVRKKKPNAWGLYDMHGNVWEWCQDWHGNYPSSPITDPKGPADGEYRSTRGGSYKENQAALRSAVRYGSKPDNAYTTIGFRVARDL